MRRVVLFPSFHYANDHSGDRADSSTSNSDNNDENEVMDLRGLRRASVVSAGDVDEYGDEDGVGDRGQEQDEDQDQDEDHDQAMPASNAAERQPNDNPFDSLSAMSLSSDSLDSLERKLPMLSSSSSSASPSRLLIEVDEDMVPSRPTPQTAPAASSASSSASSASSSISNANSNANAIAVESKRSSSGVDHRGSDAVVALSDQRSPAVQHSSPRSLKSRVSVDLSLFLDCAVCWEKMEPPIFQCRQGHTVCSSCHHKLQVVGMENCRCPVCRVPYDSQPIRCLALEKLYNNMELTCVFARFGCAVAPTYASKHLHELDCLHRPVGCICKLLSTNPRRFKECTWQGPLQDAVSHALAEHVVRAPSPGLFDRCSSPIVEDKEMTWSRLGIKTGPSGGWTYLFKAPSFDMIVRVENLNGDGYGVNIIACTTAEQASQYQFQVRVCSADERSSLTWSGVPLSLLQLPGAAMIPQESLSEVPVSPLARPSRSFIVHLPDAMHFMKKNSAGEWILELRGKIVALNHAEALGAAS